MTAANTPGEEMVGSDPKSKPPRWYNAVLNAGTTWHNGLMALAILGSALNARRGARPSQ